MRFRRVSSWPYRAPETALLVFVVLAVTLIQSAANCGPVAADEAAKATSAPLATSPRESVLLLGDHTVARTSGLTQRFFPAQKHPANPVMRQTENWEGVGPYVWGNRLMQ